MRIHGWIGAAIVSLGVALAGAEVHSQEKAEKDKKPEGGAPAISPEQQAEMEAYMKAATPGEHHKPMMAGVGDWEAAGKMWMDPASPPTETKAKSKRTAILGGRFIVDEYDGGLIMGMPFFGHGIFGYDNVKKKHVGVWMDSMGTMMMSMEGTCEGADCKSVTFNATWQDPMGRTWGFKSTTTRDGPDKETFVAWNIHPEGMPLPPGASREQKSMEIVYTRKK